MDLGIKDKERIFGMQPLTLLCALLLLLSLGRLMLIVGSSINLSGDEAHYWEWSRRPALGYYSKPPGVAYLIWISTKLFGNTELGIRFWPVVFSFFSGLLIYKLGALLFTKRAGFFAALFLQIIPLFAFISCGMTADSPLVFFWLLSLYLFYRAWQTNAWRYWLGLGLAMGLGLLCKYAIVFFMVSAFLFLVTSPKRRRFLKQPQFYISLLMAVCFLAPVVLWNAQNDWVNLRHEWGHSKAAEGFRIQPLMLAEFVGAQIGVISPILFCMMVYALIKKRKQNSFCFWFSIPILIGFTLKSIQGRVQPNWPMVAYLAGLLAFAGTFFNGEKVLNKLTKRTVIIGVFIAVLMSLFIYFPPLVSRLGVHPKDDPFKRLRGWSELGDEVSKLKQQIPGPCFIFSDYYMYCSLLAFYSEENPTIYYYNPGFRRMNQYDIWPGFENFIGYNAIYVTDAINFEEHLSDYFDSYEKHVLDLKDNKGQIYKQFDIVICNGFKGMQRRRPQDY